MSQGSDEWWRPATIKNNVLPSWTTVTSGRLLTANLSPFHKRKGSKKDPNAVELISTISQSSIVAAHHSVCLLSFGNVFGSHVCDSIHWPMYWISSNWHRNWNWHTNFLAAAAAHVPLYCALCRSITDCRQDFHQARFAMTFAFKPLVEVCICECVKAHRVHLCTQFVLLSVALHSDVPPRCTQKFWRGWNEMQQEVNLFPAALSLRQMWMGFNHIIEGCVSVFDVG